MTWKLCDLTGTVLQDGVLRNRLPGGRVDVSQNANAKASVPLSFDDPAASLIYPLATVLKVRLDGEQLFTGILIKPSIDGDSRVATINAVGQGYRAENRFIGDRDPADGVTVSNVSWNPWRVENAAQTSVFRWLREYMVPTAAETAAGNPGVGIVWDTVAGNTAIAAGGNIARTRDIPPGTQIWAAWQDLTGLERGLDFELIPVDQEDGTLCKLAVFYPQQGGDKTGTVVFHYGWGKANCTGFRYEPDGGTVVNRSKVLGQSIEGEAQKEATADLPESENAFGTYSRVEGRTDLYQYGPLSEVAQGLVEATGWPQDFFEFIPIADDGTGWRRDPNEGLVRADGIFGQAPQIGPNPNAKKAWLGDIIRVIARDGTVLLGPNGNGVYDGRVTDIGFSEPDPSGTVVKEMKCTPVIDGSGVVLT